MSKLRFHSVRHNFNPLSSFKQPPRSLIHFWSFYSSFSRLSSRKNLFDYLSCVKKEPKKMCSCFASHVDEGLIPNDKDAPRPSQTPTIPQLQAKMPKGKLTSKQMTEAYVPTSWQESSPSHPQPQSQSSDVPMAAQQPIITGRRSRGASASHGSLPDLPSTTSSDTKRSDDPTGNMLYFGSGLSPEQAMRAYKSPTPAGSSSSSTSVSSTARRKPAVAGIASGRDASGYLSSSVGSTNIMNGTYSSLTYGGSLQYNYAGTQSYGAGTAGGVGDGLL